MRRCSRGFVTSVSADASANGSPVCTAHPCAARPNPGAPSTKSMIVSSIGRHLPRTAHDHETAQNAGRREPVAALLSGVIHGSAASFPSASHLAGPSRPAMPLRLAGLGSHAASPAVLTSLAVLLRFGE